MSEHPKYLGVRIDDAIESVDPVPWTHGPVAVTLHCREFSSHCPVTNQPDYAMLKVEYVPRDHIIETKSMKLYLQKFRDVRQFNEALVHQICQELGNTINPVELSVTGVFNPRGGINVECRSEYGKEESCN
jgi:7-cyano-7-deazaguanine reductase